MRRCSYAAALLTVANLTFTVVLLVRDWHRQPTIPLPTGAKPTSRRSLTSTYCTEAHTGRRLLQSPQENVPPGTVTTYEFPWNPDLTRADPTGAYVALCLVVKNQHRDIREWLLYHKWIGIGKIYVYDHDSNLPLLGVIHDQVRSGFVEYTHFTGHHKPGTTFMETAQGYAYHDCLDRHRAKHRWMGFVDADEFLVVTDRETPDLRAVLRDYEGFGGLALNWVLFSSSGHVHRPEGLVLTNYYKCYHPSHKINKHIKVFVNPRFTLGLYDTPHQAIYSREDLFTVSENMERVDGAYTYRTSHRRLALHHYMTKSEDEWREKMERGAGDGKKENMHNFKVIRILARHNCTLGVDAGRAFLASPAAAALNRTPPPRATPPSTQPRMVLFPAHNATSPVHIPITISHEG